MPAAVLRGGVYTRYLPRAGCAAGALLTCTGLQLLCDVSRGGQRPLIPEVDRKRVFQTFHELSHPGRHATRRLMSARVVWRGMSSTLQPGAKTVSSLLGASPQPSAPIQPIPVP